MELFERPKSGERAILVHVDFSAEHIREDVDEFGMLATSAGATIAAWVRASRAQPDPRYFIGTGKVEELRQALADESADLVMFNHILSPSQERNLEKVLQCRVLDRTGLILDIFAQRARTHEGKLQVELAQLEHLSTRLIRGWTHLERQRGGIGLRGPGETQLETDRRLIGHRIRTIQKRLEQVRKQRSQARRSRQRNEVPTVSLVGYTNAGKSTLFNAMTRSDVYAADQLFATLDPTLRRIPIPDVGPIVLADTVGFIRHLPHKLVESFRATLEESRESDLLLHVVDACSEARDDNIFQVNTVLKETGAGEIPTLMVYNKIDLMGEFPPRVERDADGVSQAVWLSAQTGAGIQLLLDVLRERLGKEMVEAGLWLSPAMGELRAALYRQQGVLNEQVDDTGRCHLQIRIARKEFEQTLKKLGISAQDLVYE
ncbi:GTP-binding protein HflX [gamma proteobacterium HdN1]|nr:GTP-binding protein HflX [gamma proteobacterium HdN1]